MASHRRFVTTALALFGVATLAGCINKPLRPVNTDGTYCHRIGKSYRPTLTCTPTPVPGAAAEAQAKRFEGDPAAFTIYVLRRRWGDASVALAFDVDGAARPFTIPNSLVRLRLTPGRHRLSMQWDGRTSDLAVTGNAGQTQFVELVGSGWIWGTTFRWQPMTFESATQRASPAKLVADLDLR